MITIWCCSIVSSIHCCTDTSIDYCIDRPLLSIILIPRYMGSTLIRDTLGQIEDSLHYSGFSINCAFHMFPLVPSNKHLTHLRDIDQIEI
jgi:hypothetical protein